MMKLKINDRAALAIKNRTKRVEIRANKNDEHDYNSLKENDIIEFTSNNLGVFYVKVKEVNHYNTLEELFTLEGTKYTTSSTDVKEEAIKSINSLDGYEEAISKSGVYAIHIEYLYSENTVWEELLEKAIAVRQSRDVSGMISAGQVSAAILTKNHNIYTGVCIDTACSIGMCAERNALSTMITNGEFEVEKLVCIGGRGLMLPCGVCREFMMQLSKENGELDILIDMDKKETIKLKDLIPNWWN